MGNKAANAQAKATTEASAAAVAEQRRQYDLSRADMQPWMQQGSGAVNQLGYLLGLPSPSNQPGAAQQPIQRTPFQPRNTLAMRYGGGREFINDGDFGFGSNWGGASTQQQAPAEAPYSGHGGYYDSHGNWNEIIPGSSNDPKSVNFDNWEILKNGGYKAKPDATQAPQAGFGSLMRDFSSADFEKDPGYDFRLAEGQKALERSAAARGNALGGSAVKASQRFGQDYASNEFLNAYNRFQSNRATKYNQLAGLAGLGQQSANTLANAGTNSANNISGILVNQGNRLGDARASGYASTANAINGGLNNLLSLYGGG
jgi:hypothetical protein